MSALLQELTHKVSRLRSGASAAEREAALAQGTADETSKRMRTALELATALRGEATRWAASADSIEVRCCQPACWLSSACSLKDGELTRKMQYACMRASG